jgi:hypothetical protein
MCPKNTFRVNFLFYLQNRILNEYFSLSQTLTIYVAFLVIRNAIYQMALFRVKFEKESGKIYLCPPLYLFSLINDIRVFGTRGGVVG